MKKIVILVSIVLCVLMVSSVAFAESTTGEAVTEETKAFDRTVYESSENYSYDKFDKTWSVYAAYSKKYSDAVIVFGLKVEGNKDSVQLPPYFYVWVRESNNQDTKWKITGLQIIANDLIFSAKEILVDDSSSILLLDSEKGKQLLSAITEGKELDFKVIFSTGSHIESITGDDYEEIKQLAKLIVENDAWAFVVDDKGNDMSTYDKLIEKTYPIEIIE